MAQGLVGNGNGEHQSSLPKLVFCLRDYSASTFVSDAVAGVTVGLVALPLAMAFAIASGVAPQSGIYCAIVAGFVISASGGRAPTRRADRRVRRGRRWDRGGARPRRPFDVHLDGRCRSDAARTYGARHGRKVHPPSRRDRLYQRHRCAHCQHPDQGLLGPDISTVPGEFLGRLQAIGRHWHTVSWPKTTVSLSALAGMLVLRRYRPNVPGSVLALLIGTTLTWALHLPCRRSTRGSEAFRALGRPSLFRASASISSCHCCHRR